MRTKSKRLAILLMIITILSVAGCGKTKDVQEIDLSVAAQWMQQEVPEPMYGSVGGEWLVLGLARSSVQISEDYFSSYYQNLENILTEYEGILDERKYTEYSRVILALTAIGKNPENVAGYNLLTPLANYEKTIFQGINGPVFALLALDSGRYEIPLLEGEGIQADRQMYLEYILEKESPDGGWSLAGGAGEADMTAMVLQALAKYQEDEKIAAAIERGLQFLSEQQQEDGGYIAYGTQSSETVSQVIVALTELGISPEDSRFVKNGTTLKENLLSFMTEEGAFSHTLGEEADLMATEQAFYALTALERAAQGETALYRMVSE